MVSIINLVFGLLYMNCRILCNIQKLFLFNASSDSLKKQVLEKIYCALAKLTQNRGKLCTKKTFQRCYIASSPSADLLMKHTGYYSLSGKKGNIFFLCFT
jgi:hypothetical protein